jgi:hypothetical protein
MKAARIARDLDCFVSLVTACSNVPADPTSIDAASQGQGGGGSSMLDRPCLEEVLHDVRSSADGFNKPMFSRVMQVAASAGPSVLPVDAFSIWHMQVCDTMRRPRPAVWHPRTLAPLVRHA